MPIFPAGMTLAPGIPMALEGHLKEGFTHRQGRRSPQLDAQRVAVADELRARLLRGRDDACRRIAL